MIEKFSNILLSSMKDGEDSAKNKMARLLYSIITFYGVVSMFIVFVTSFFQGVSIITYSVSLLISLLFAALFFAGRKSNVAILSRIGFALTFAGGVAVYFLFPNQLLVFVGITFLLPAYSSICMSRYSSLIVSIVVVTVLSSVYIMTSSCDMLNILFFAITMLFVYTLATMVLYYSDLIVDKCKNEISDLQTNIDKKQDFISKLSHRIRTPLSNILGIANIIGETNGPSKKQLIDSLVASVKTITDIVEIIDEESGKGTVKEKEKEVEEISTFDLRELITQTGEFTQNFEVKLEVYGDLPRLRGDAVKIRRIFLNIFDFFLQNTPSDKLPARVTIAVNRVRIPITPIKYRFDIKSLTTINLQEDANIPELTIAKRLIENMNGNIKRRFEEDLTCIYFNICFDGEEDMAPSQSESIKVQTNVTTGFTNDLKEKTLAEADIIVCDDNPINQKVMSLSLDKHVKSITLASNGQECVDMVSRKSYDLILMDIQMPVLDGYSATSRIRQIEKDNHKTHIPIIAVTANTLAGDKQHCLSVGMDDYVSKPFQLEDVLNKMRILVSKYPQA